MKKIYVWYSGATDVTGNNIINGLKEKLNSELFTVTGGVTKPRGSVDFVIGYGTKTREDVTLGGAHVINSPNKIRVNRNKLKALEVMATVSDIPLAKFAKIQQRNLGFLAAFNKPLIMRTNYHQSARGLTLCLNADQAKSILTKNINGFGYVQELIPFKHEYRIHVLNDSIIACAKKVQQDDPENSWKTNYSDKIKISAEKKEMTLNSETTRLMELCLNVISKDSTLPNYIVKSNKNGWCFKSINSSTAGNKIISIAKKAVKALGLNFGAVDCAIDYSGNPYVIEVNSGPGLKSRTLNAYILEFVKYINNENDIQERENTTATASQPVPEATRQAGVEPHEQESLQSMQAELNRLVVAAGVIGEKISQMST